MSFVYRLMKLLIFYIDCITSVKCPKCVNTKFKMVSHVVS